VEGFRTHWHVSKFSSFAEYPARSLAGAEAALLTAWASLERFSDDLVLVGGLALKYLTKQGGGWLPGPVTMDVDLGVTLGTEGRRLFRGQPAIRNANLVFGGHAASTALVSGPSLFMPLGLESRWWRCYDGATCPFSKVPRSVEILPI
jgi:hypothetical protein